MKKYAAFTLIELLISVSLIGMVVAFVVPTYQLILSQAQLSSATNQIVEIFRLQIQKTVTEQKIYGVSLSATSAVMTYRQCTNPTCTTTTNTSYTIGPSTIATFLCRNPDCSAKDVTLVALPVNVVVDTATFGGQREIRFSTAGAPSSSGSVVLRDTTRNRRRSIDLRPSGAILPGSREY